MGALPIPGHTRPWHRVVALVRRPDGLPALRRLAPDPRAFRAAERWLAAHGYQAEAALCQAVAAEIHGRPAPTYSVQARHGRPVVEVPTAGLAAAGERVTLHECAGAVVILPAPQG